MLRNIGLLTALGSVLAMSLVVACSRDQANEHATTGSAVHDMEDRQVLLGSCRTDAPPPYAEARLTSAKVWVTIATRSSERVVVSVHLGIEEQGLEGSVMLPVSFTSRVRSTRSASIRFVKDERGTFRLGARETPVDRVVLGRGIDPEVSHLVVELDAQDITEKRRTLAQAYGCRFSAKEWRVVEDPLCEGLLDNLEVPEKCRIFVDEQQDAAPKPVLTDAAADADALENTSDAEAHDPVGEAGVASDASAIEGGSDLGPDATAPANDGGAEQGSEKGGKNGESGGAQGDEDNVPSSGAGSDHDGSSGQPAQTRAPDAGPPEVFTKPESFLGCSSSSFSAGSEGSLIAAVGLLLAARRRRKRGIEQ